MTDTLRKIVTNPTIRPTLIDECVGLVESEVDSKGLIIRGAYKTVKKIKPDFVKGAIDGLLEDWIDKLEPYYQDWGQKKEGTFSAHVNSRTPEVADSLLDVTDQRAKLTKHKAIAKIYDKLRPSALKNVESAVPGLSALIQSHL